jgi:hypothetical protein
MLGSPTPKVVSLKVEGKKARDKNCFTCKLGPMIAGEKPSKLQVCNPRQRLGRSQLK